MFLTSLISKHQKASSASTRDVFSCTCSEEKHQFYTLTALPTKLSGDTFNSRRERYEFEKRGVTVLQWQSNFAHFRSILEYAKYIKKGEYMLEEIYTNGIYLKKHPEWHIDESPWKVRHIMRMMKRHHIMPNTICEVGCGAGEVLRLLQARMGDECTFWGYDISPQAIALCGERENERLHFKLADFRLEKEAYFDLILILDVIEHIEDYFSFLRDLKQKSRYKIFHIPLDISVQTVLRGKTLIRNRNAHGHIHYFTKETALRTLEDVGYEVLDYSYSPEYELDEPLLQTKIMKLPRKFYFALQENWAVRILGGFRLLVLAR